MNFFTKKPANVMYEENSAHLERDLYVFKAKTNSSDSVNFP
jgi:hypothetical protein